MAITFVQKRKTQKYLVLVFGAMVLIIAFIFLSRYFLEEEAFISPPVISKHLPPAKINFQVLEDPVFQKLSKPFPELPPLPLVGEIGRENPFLPYQKEVFEE